MKSAFLVGALCLLSIAASRRARDAAGAASPSPPEHRCALYDRDDYRYPQSVELAIIVAHGR